MDLTGVWPSGPVTGVHRQGHTGPMSSSRVGWVVAAVLLGTVAALVGNWWTAGAMVCLVISQVEAERRDRAALARDSDLH